MAAVVRTPAARRQSRARDAFSKVAREVRATRTAMAYRGMRGISGCQRRSTLRYVSQRAGARRATRMLSTARERVSPNDAAERWPPDALRLGDASGAGNCCRRLACAYDFDAQKAHRPARRHESRRSC